MNYDFFLTKETSFWSYLLFASHTEIQAVLNKDSTRLWSGMSVEPCGYTLNKCQASQMFSGIMRICFCSSHIHPFSWQFRSQCKVWYQCCGQKEKKKKKSLHLSPRREDRRHWVLLLVSQRLDCAMTHTWTPALQDSVFANLAQFPGCKVSKCIFIFNTKD